VVDLRQLGGVSSTLSSQGQVDLGRRGWHRGTVLAEKSRVGLHVAWLSVARRFLGKQSEEKHVIDKKRGPSQCAAFQ